MVCSILLNLPRRAGGALPYVWLWGMFSACEMCSLLALFVWADEFLISSCCQCSPHQTICWKMCSCSLFWFRRKFWSRNQTFLHFWFFFFVPRGKTAWTMSGSSLSHQHVFKPAFWLQISFSGYPISVQLPFFFGLYFSPHKLFIFFILSDVPYTKILLSSFSFHLLNSFAFLFGSSR